MSELAGFGAPSWLPASVARRIEHEDARERAEAKRAEAERADRADKAHDRALMAYRTAAEARGEVVSAMELATGQDIGRSIQDVLADAAAAAEREDGRAAARDRRRDGDVEYIDAEPVIHGQRSSGWPESEYQLERMLRQADELHRDLVAVRARHNYADAVEAAREKAHPFVARSAYTGPVIYR